MIGQIVPSCQATVSKDIGTAWLYPQRMAGISEEQLFNEALVARTHRLRNERGWTSAQMATALGVPADRYRKYEYRTPLPHYLLERFALIVGRDIEYILTGKMVPARVAEAERRRKAS